MSKVQYQDIPRQQRCVEEAEGGCTGFDEGVILEISNVRTTRN